MFYSYEEALVLTKLEIAEQYFATVVEEAQTANSISIIFYSTNDKPMQSLMGDILDIVNSDPPTEKPQKQLQ